MRLHEAIRSYGLRKFSAWVIAVLRVRKLKVGDTGVVLWATMRIPKTGKVGLAQGSRQTSPTTVLQQHLPLYMRPC